MGQEAKRIVLINDLPGYGKVALAAMVPLFSRMGHYTYQLPTAVISNTLDFGKFRIQDMTDYMRDTIQVWEELGFDPDCICTGFVLSEEQVELIGKYIKSRNPAKKRLVMVDPIMADGGRLYNGIGQERVAAMRSLVSYSDVMVPNMTEASFLTGIRPGQETGTRGEIRELVDGLRRISGKSVVITSVLAGDGRTGGGRTGGGRAENEHTGDGRAGEHLVCGYDHVQQEYFEVPYDYLPVRVAGSGDIFSTVMTGELLAGKTLKDSVEKAVRVLTRLIVENEGHFEGYKGILVERYWEVLEE